MKWKVLSSSPSTDKTWRVVWGRFQSAAKDHRTKATEALRGPHKELGTHPDVDLPFPIARIKYSIVNPLLLECSSDQEVVLRWIHTL